MSRLFYLFIRVLTYLFCSVMIHFALIHAASVPLLLLGIGTAIFAIVIGFMAETEFIRDLLLSLLYSIKNKGKEN